MGASMKNGETEKKLRMKKKSVSTTETHRKTQI